MGSREGVTGRKDTTLSVEGLRRGSRMRIVKALGLLWGGDGLPTPLRPLGWIREGVA